jgi:hypothetical protein
LLAVVGALAAAEVASARPALGIDDQSTRMLRDKRFLALHVKRMRLVVPYDVMRQPRSLGRYAPVLDLARKRRVSVLVSFNYSQRHPRWLPSVREYTRDIRAFHARFPWVREITVWNEPNHVGRPTYRRPRRVAQFFNAARRVFDPAHVVAVDILAEAGFEQWASEFRRYAKSPRIWGLHNYFDVNHGRDIAIAQLRSVIGSRSQIWLTETAGLVRFAHRYPYDERRAAAATRWALQIAMRDRVARVYLYDWSGPPLGSRWDSGLIAAGGRPRPALNVVQDYLHRPLTRIPRIPRIPAFPTRRRHRARPARFVGRAAGKHVDASA